jgi:hypothetical protein
MPTPAAMHQLANLRDEPDLLKQLRVRLITGQPEMTSDLLLVDRACDNINGAILQTDVRLRSHRDG